MMMHSAQETTAVGPYFRDNEVVQLFLFNLHLQVHIILSRCGKKMNILELVYIFKR